MAAGMYGGEARDPSYCHMTDSHQGHRLPAVVDSYSIDEPVYGVRGLAGNMIDWTSSHYRADWGRKKIPRTGYTAEGAGATVQGVLGLRVATMVFPPAITMTLAFVYVVLCEVI